MKYLLPYFLSMFFWLIPPLSHMSAIIVQNRTYPYFPSFLKTESNWVDSVFLTLTPKERIAQLFMVAAYSEKNRENRAYIENLIKKHKIGGLIFMQGTPEAQIDLINRYQQLSSVPLLIGMDAERGLGFRLRKVPVFPSQMMLGAIENDNIIKEIGKEIARQCKRVGVHVNFSPVADINNNINNPVIMERSFGENRKNVTRKAITMAMAMQNEGIIAVGKHFPGHGDTDVDSHLGLPLINFSLERLDSIELYPFRELIKNGIAGIMTAHLNIPAYDTIQRIASLSPKIVKGLLKNKLGFNGLVFTDALNMRGVADYYPSGKAELQALLAGNDILLFSTDVHLSIERIDKAVRDGIITQSDIDMRVKKVLKAKQWVGLDSLQWINRKSVWNDLNNQNAELLNFKAIENAICVAKNDNNLIPIKGLDSLKILSTGIGIKHQNHFQKMLNKYTNVRYTNLPENATTADFDKVIKSIQGNYDLIIVNIHTNKKRGIFKIKKSIKQFIEKAGTNRKLVLNYFGIPYGISQLDDLKPIDAILISYDDAPDYQKIAAQIIFGGLAAKGKLPVSAHHNLKEGTGQKTKAIRLGYVAPELVGMNPKILRKISAVVKDGIKEKALPGARILVARKGKIVFNKSYGYHTYDKKQKVRVTDIYDLASVTKIVGSLPAVMKLYEEDKIVLDSSISQYIPLLKGSNKESLSLWEILSHQAGLISWIPYHHSLVDSASYEGKFVKPKREIPYTIKVDKDLYVNNTFQFKKGVFSDRKSKKFPLQVADNMYISKTHSDTLFYVIKESELLTKEYRYSDLGFILMKPLIEKLTGQKFETYLQHNFYQKLGASTLTFNPLEKFTTKRIVPTAVDSLMRKQRIHGTVHDPNAALLGGVSGHAGLFSNAEDLAKVLQMYLNGGNYGGERFLHEKTLNLFTSRVYPNTTNRRGLGFDKPQTDSTLISPVTRRASPESYGHGGFTGILAWVDPIYDLIYIFQSNRVHPNDWNRKIYEMDIRSRIHEIIYDAIIADRVPVPFKKLINPKSDSFFQIRFQLPDLLDT